jgi:DNA-binding CsgD family transcriptional regulator
LVYDEFVKQFSLTLQEIEMISLIRDGISSQDIAEKSNLSLLTVKTHRRNINFKLKTETTAELIRFMGFESFTIPKSILTHHLQQLHSNF